MKRTLTILALFAVVALLAGPAAEAGPFKKDKKKAAPAKIWRYDKYPDMSFHKGILRQDGRAGWKLDELELVLAEKCEIFGEGGDRLQSGRTAVVMGARVGNTIVAWTVQMHKATVSSPNLDDKDTHIEWSTSDPTVGVGRAPS